MQPTLEAAHLPRPVNGADGRILVICALAVLLGIAAGLVAQILTFLIAVVTNLAFYGRWSHDFSISPAGNHLGAWLILVPALGGVLVGLMARYGSKAIRGHGIPEAMEQILTNQSRIPARVTFLKPLSAAIAIGTGGPFGAEGPIIATGGALGSVLGQMLSTSAQERKVLLAAGAAAGMAATFGSPISAVLLAIELLLFEFAPRSVIPVALASTAATIVRFVLHGTHPAFPIPDLLQPSASALILYTVIGALVGLVSVFVTRAVYGVEDAFERVGHRLGVHWMWWPAFAGLVVGAIGLISPRTLGVGYDNITGILSGSLTLRAVTFLSIWKFISWAIALGSGTSGGTLAPLFTIGGGLGAVLGAATVALLPMAGVDVRMTALVGMAAIFAGASRAMLASVVFAFETTRQPTGLLPLLGGCTAAYLVSLLLMRTTIMTEKIARRGVRVLDEYATDPFSQIMVRERASSTVTTLSASETIARARTWFASHRPETLFTAYPILDDAGSCIGLVTRQAILAPETASESRIGDLVQRRPVVVYSDAWLSEAIALMISEGVGRLLVLEGSRVPGTAPARPGNIVGVLTRSDILGAYAQRLHDGGRSDKTLAIATVLRAIPRSSPPSPPPSPR